MKNAFVASVLMSACALAVAKLPPVVLDDAGKLKAAEAAAKTAWQGKLDAFQLCQVQDRVVAHYRKTAASTAGKPQPAGASGTPAAMVAANPSVPGGTASAPAGAATPTGCADPGPFAFTPPAEKPLETSGAHSPAGNASSPPSVIAPSAAMAPAKK